MAPSAASKAYRKISKSARLNYLHLVVGAVCVTCVSLAIFPTPGVHLVQKYGKAHPELLLERATAESKVHENSISNAKVDSQASEFALSPDWATKYGALWKQLSDIPVVLTAPRLSETAGPLSCARHKYDANVKFASWEEARRQVPGLLEALPATQPSIGGFNITEIRRGPFQARPTCAVVGNGGALRNQLLGAAIDSKDLVIRFNRGPTKGFERHVGSKSSVRLMNGVWNDAIVPGEVVISEGRDEALRQWIKNARKRPTEPKFLLDFEFLCHCWKWVEHQGDKPSSGLVGVFFALALCRSVDVYGFDFTAYFNKSAWSHYYDHERPKVGRENAHPFETEAALYKSLQHAGKLHIHSAQAPADAKA